MKITSLILLLLCFTSIFPQSQKEKTLLIYTWGYAPRRGSYNDSCGQWLKQKYGFAYKVKAGCVVYGFQVRRWRRHNRRVERRLRIKFGTDWRENYFRDEKLCERACAPATGNTK